MILLKQIFRKSVLDCCNYEINCNCGMYSLLQINISSNGLRFRIIELIFIKNAHFTNSPLAITVKRNIPTPGTPQTQKRMVQTISTLFIIN